MKEKLFMAKSNGNPSEWLPLWMHLEDTAGIMNHLLEDFIPESFCDSCGMERDIFEKTALFIAYIHDIGKATVAFQYKISKSIPVRTGELEKFCIKLPDFIDDDYSKKTPHGLAGEMILRYFGCNENIAAVVGAHHGVPAEKGTIGEQKLDKEKSKIKSYENYFGNDKDEKENRRYLENAWKNIIDEALKYSGFSSLDEIPDIQVTAQMLMSGLIIVADWMASNTEFFPLISVDDTGDESLYPERVENAWNELKLPDMWRKYNQKYCDTAFKDTFGFIPREFQRKILDAAENTDNPGLLIIEAPMGCGKTEAALASAEIFAAKSKKNGLFFGLPTQATANGLFPRIQSWAEKQSDEFYHSIQLKHGNSAFNRTFQKIQKDIPDEDTDNSGLVAHSWFDGNKTACLADFVVATVDQMLMLALKRRHVMMLHLGLSEKVVVIDEVHAYDAYMNQYLETALRWLGAYHTPVILLSATLPAERRVSLLKAYLNIKNTDKSIEENISYPLLTWTDGKDIKQESLPYADKHLSVSVRKISNNDIISAVQKAVECGSCVGIIVNTVKRAQDIAEDVHQKITDNVLLYHSQYIMSDRTIKEEKLLKHTGKISTDEMRKGFVAVGTQVLEQSLDIDFDLLITDICPIDLLLQRIGRLHRHERNRPEKLNEPVCLVVTDEYENDKTGSKKIYDEWLLKTTFSYLPDKICLPDDISVLVQKVYSAQNKNDSMYNKYINNKKIKESHSKSFRLNAPECRSIHSMLERFVDSDAAAEASVRDGLPSIEVLVMKRYNDNKIYFPDGTELSADLTDEECRKINEQRLRLPARFSQKWNIEKTVKELENQCIKSWQDKYLLKDKLVLFLDENNETELLKCHLKYSSEKGLICKGESDENE